MQEFQIRVLEGRGKFISRIAGPGLIISLLVVILCSACSNQVSGNLSPSPVGGERPGTTGTSYTSYGFDDIQDVQHQVDSQASSYRRDDAIATTLQFMHEGEFKTTGTVLSSTLVWADPDREALVSVDTDRCWYRFMLQKLLRQDSSGAWFVVGYDSQPKEFGLFLTLRTQDVDEAQQNLPFQIVLPTYLPGNMEAPPWISGPVGNNSNGDFYLVSLDYISAEPDADYTAFMMIRESNQPGSIDFGQEGYWHDVIDGVEVKWSSTPMPEKNKASDIRFCQFFWNQGNTGFMVQIYGFPQSEATKVVTSMIQSGAS